eukprot:TRINITY_DN30315_c0_g1_i1.p1 TRINITY_DN30315_c0_g1~~TRINITY_DN30315_c0_g1_i1.p1  ORF type:complete len:447 (-),score=80.25 TRINITY_DN30315_c0_g1_i1:101-1441(-)
MQPHKIIVRNTFIDFVPEQVEEEDPLQRTQSDPTGSQLKQDYQLQRTDSVAHRPPAVQEGTRAEEAGEQDGDQYTFQGLTDSGGCFTQSSPEDEDEDDGGLQRTKSIMNGNKLPHGAQQSSDQSTRRSVNLNHLVASGDGFANMKLGGMPSYIGVGAGSSMGSSMGGFGLPYPQVSPWGGGYMNPSAIFPGGSDLAAMMSYQFQPQPQVNETSSEAGGYMEEQMKKHEASASSIAELDAAQTPSLGVPALGEGPAMGRLHSFHQETRDMGMVSLDFRQFTKVGYEGRLSVVSENKVRTDGLHRYLVQFTGGEISRADGVGFVFSQRLPCAKNIQRIVSIFVNQRGRICMRIFADLVRASAYIKAIELGDWVEMAIDLDNKIATFNLWPNTPAGWPSLTSKPSSTAEFPFGNRLGKLNAAQQKQVKLNVGHLACVVKNVGVTITLGS